MHVQILSDLHLEFLSPKRIKNLLASIKPVGTVLVLAGDIGTPAQYHQVLETVAPLFEKIFVVLGNHEYYKQKDMMSVHQTIQSICDQWHNVSFLSSSYEHYHNYRWIGTTLWSKIDTPLYHTNDTRLIKGMDIAIYNQLYQESVDFLTETLETSDPCIVITHYLPSEQLIHEKYKSDPYNQWFASSLDDLIEKHTHHLPLWIYGHTHDPSDKILFKTRMVCNPFGYENENKKPNLQYIVSVENNSS